MQKNLVLQTRDWSLVTAKILELDGSGMFWNYAVGDDGTYFVFASNPPSVKSAAVMQ